jgi:hypothetical protein
MIPSPNILNSDIYWFAMSRERLMPPMAMLEPLIRREYVLLLRGRELLIWLQALPALIWIQHP